jgi:hypothetical protein
MSEGALTLAEKLSKMWSQKLVSCSYRGCLCGLAKHPEVRSPGDTNKCVASLEGKCNKALSSPQIRPRFKKGKKK